MSDRIANLHTAVRRYCIEQHQYWVREYAVLSSSRLDRSGSHYTDEALRIFPRYNVLNAILTEVERLRPAEFRNLDEAKELLKLAAQTAESDFTRANTTEIEIIAKQEERDKLEAFIERLNETELSSVQPLFFRRVLAESERKELWKNLTNRWNLPKGYWYPLSDDRPENVEAFQDYFFENELTFETLRAILRKSKVETVFELQEWETQYEMEVSVLEPFYGGSEGYWCDRTFDWIIYASHEGSVTIGGWLLAEVKSAWPNWTKRVWTSPFFERTS